MNNMKQKLTGKLLREIKQKTRVEMNVLLGQIKKDAPTYQTPHKQIEAVKVNVYNFLGIENPTEEVLRYIEIYINKKEQMEEWQRHLHKCKQETLI